MINRHFEEELGRLKDLAAEFAGENPALAPMLLGSSADPDVERLLEGTAFLTAQLRRRLDDSYPEFVQDLTRLLFPQHLLALPASAMVAFEALVEDGAEVNIPADTELLSVPVQGTRCRFRTSHALRLAPVHIDACSMRRLPGAPPQLRLSLRAVPDAAPPGQLRLFLHGSHAEACHLLLLLTRHLRCMRLSTRGQRPDRSTECTLPPGCVLPCGFEHPLLDYPLHAFDGYRVLQEYLAQPAKFLFVEIGGLDALPAGWRELDIDFEFDRDWPWIPEIRPDTLRLGVVPAVNLFDIDAEPIDCDHRHTEYPLRALDEPHDHYQIHDIQRVLGSVRGQAQAQEWHPFVLYPGAGKAAQPSFRSVIRPHPLRDTPQTLLTLCYPPEQPVYPQVLSVRLRCSNGALPESLGPGDICRAGTNTPGRVRFHNLHAPSAYRRPRIDADLMWRLQSHAALNYFSIADARTLRSMLSLHADAQQAGGSAEAVAQHVANRRRIEGIEVVHAVPHTLLAGNCGLLRGQRVRVCCRGDHFAGLGDLYLFGCVLDAFLADYVGINSFVCLEIEDTQSSRIFTWKPRIGTRPTL